jgi:hypothetical protein
MSWRHSPGEELAAEQPGTSVRLINQDSMANTRANIPVPRVNQECHRGPVFLGQTRAKCCFRKQNTPKWHVRGFVESSKACICSS